MHPYDIDQLTDKAIAAETERQEDEFGAMVKRAAECGFWLYVELKNMVHAYEIGEQPTVDRAKELIEKIENKKSGLQAANKIHH